MTAGSLRIGLVAGEASGDRLGAALMRAIGERRPEVRFEGMAGPRMIEAGCREVAHIDELSVMGLVEVLRSYPRLLGLRKRLVSHFLDDPPDVVIGIDVPDFNLGLERRLKRRGIPTVHYVCPQAWAWRAGRARDLASAADRLLALLPFEPQFFSAHGVQTEFVGHPLADALPLDPDKAAARGMLGLDPDGQWVALMPGSRKQELDRLLEPFVAAARVMQGHCAEIRFLICVVHERDVERVKRAAGGLTVEVFVGQAQHVLTAADAAIVASGTVTLEALLCGTPTVVGYRLSPLSYFIIRRMVTIPHIALPNILAGRELVPELIQDEMTPARLAAAVLAWLHDSARRERYAHSSRELHALMRRDAAARAAASILSLIGDRR